MGAVENIRLVQQAYAAFGRGDIPAVLETLNPAVDWEAIIGAGDHVPTAGRRRGLDAVQGFFDDLASNVEFSKFEPREFFGNNETVVVLGAYAGLAKPTGRPFASDWVMVFTVRDGRIVQFREFADIGAINAAF
jgi:ketosteroid isomerase-like protein